MFLVGELGERREYWKGMGYVKVTDQITRDDLVKARENADFHVVDLGRLMFYDPEKNEWVDLDRR